MSRHIIETEETLIIETPERVPLEFALASIGNRFLAVAIDHFIQYLSIFIVAWVLFALAGMSASDVVDSPDKMFSEMPKWTIAITILGLFLIFAGYFIFFEWLLNGQTPGKKLMKLRVIREDGRPITLWEAIARNLLRIGDAVPGFIIPVYSIGLITIFLSNRDQRLGDIFAGTVVIRERADEAPTFAQTFSNPVSDTAFSRVQKRLEFQADIDLVSEVEIEVVESFLRRRWDLTDKQRIWMAWRVALPLMYKLKPNYDITEFTYEGFLEELLHRYHARRKFLN
ncbi:MAG TPA: RDD family protein [Pyrinomonadaceae bacterium]|nr:RDD family protein [Chloracidobacterium sp.]MBP9108057.1 RDD family protein [Pyrinomonadaceae bacterium]MBK7802008.1 RDD family protein [Chloracidobacterium sp.]MBK9437848.1 RDD family protein [Chloracidobacterium sp.]MBL0242312.1 RDD family protein [Chloracidobacterium sp.]